MKLKLYNCLGDNETPVSEYPIGLGYLVTNCTGADIEIVSKRSDLTDCDMIGLSAVTQGVSEAVQILEAADVPVVIGGQCTLWDGLQSFSFKHIVLGEGELALQWILAGDAERVVKCKHVEDIDVFSYPERGRCAGAVPILTSRGCPWNCHFCSSQQYWGKPRYHSAEYFCGEVDYILSRYPAAKLLYILDDLFIANRERFESIYDYWMGHGYHRKLQLHGFVRSNLVDIGMARKLKRMGFRQVRFGAESGSDRLLEVLNKKTTVAQHQNCIDVCNEVGLPVVYSLMSFIPGETVQDRLLTAEFIQRNVGKSQIAGNYAFRPFPGTRFYDGESPLENNWCTRGN